MSTLLSSVGNERFRLLSTAVVIGVAIVAGSQASLELLILLLGMSIALLMMRHLELHLFALVFSALLVPFEVRTGTEVMLNATALAVPFALAAWLLPMIVEGQIALVPSSINKPLLLFVASGLFSLVVGSAIWHPSVPRPSNFIVVQLAQWALYCFSAIAFLLTANIVKKVALLRQLSFFFMFVAGSVAILLVIPGVGGTIQSYVTLAFIRAPLWMLLAALSLGQLLFNRQLSRRWRLFLMAVLLAVLVYVFGIQRVTNSFWLGVTAVVGLLGWLRWPKLRWPVVLLLLALTVSGVLFSSLYQFAGGDSEWMSSGGSRLALIGRVLELTWNNNPVTGLGPAAYRLYGYREPLVYEHIVWITPRLSSHNNYVDLFSQMGIVGLLLFCWFAYAVGRVGLKLRERFPDGFEAGYVNGMLAAGGGSLLIMLLADWLLPFVYNIGFSGFQASVLVWVFLGGIVMLERLPEREALDYEE